jgi:hypothetical protein
VPIKRSLLVKVDYANVKKTGISFVVKEKSTTFASRLEKRSGGRQTSSVLLVKEFNCSEKSMHFNVWRLYPASALNAIL